MEEKKNGAGFSGAYGGKSGATKKAAKKAFGGGAKVGLADNRKVSTSASGREYHDKWKKNDGGKYVRNTSAKSLKDSIDKASDSKGVAKKINSRMEDNRRKTIKAAAEQKHKGIYNGGAAKLKRNDRNNRMKAKGQPKGMY